MRGASWESSTPPGRMQYVHLKVKANRFAMRRDWSMRDSLTMYNDLDMSPGPWWHAARNEELIPHVRQRWGSLEFHPENLPERYRRTGDEFGTVYGSHGYEIAYGWPRLSMMRRASSHAGAPVPESSGWRVGTRQHRRGPARPIVLPTTPIWSGVASNTVFFGAAALTLMVAVRILGDWSRYRRGRCPHCRYDLCHDFSTGCPECGWRRSDSAAA